MAQPPSGDPGPAPGVVYQVLGIAWPEEFGDERLELARTTMGPATILPATEFDGSWLARVESGVLTVAAIEGTVWIQGFGGSEDEPLEGGTARLEPGQLLSFGPDAILVWENRGTAPVSILTTAIVDEDRESMTVLDPTVQPEPTSRAQVVNRFVLTGPGSTGDRYRITVTDRSGQVIGARVPGDRELRFARWGAGDLDPTAIGIGPVAFIERGVSEMLIRWGGTPCGPVVTLDVAPDISAIRIIDRTPGCDAAGTEYWLVLRFRGRVPLPEDIEGSWVRRG